MHKAEKHLIYVLLQEYSQYDSYSGINRKHVQGLKEQNAVNILRFQSPCGIKSQFLVSSF